MSQVTPTLCSVPTLASVLPQLVWYHRAFQDLTKPETPKTTTPSPNPQRWGLGFYMDPQEA